MHSDDIPGIWTPAGYAACNVRVRRHLCVVVAAAVVVAATVVVAVDAAAALVISAVAAVSPMG